MQADQLIRKELERGEKLLWAGIPRQGVTLQKADAFLIPFSIMWGGFAIFWEASVLMIPSSTKGPPADIVFPLFGIPFVAIGLYMMVGRFFVDAKMRSKTFYGVTDRRAIIVSGLFSREVKSLPLRTISDVTMTEKSDGSGTILLGPSSGPSSAMQGAAWPGMNRATPPQFAMIPKARQVYALIRQGQEAQAPGVSV